MTLWGKMLLESPIFGVAVNFRTDTIYVSAHRLFVLVPVSLTGHQGTQRFTPRTSRSPNPGGQYVRGSVDVRVFRMSTGHTPEFAQGGTIARVPVSAPATVLARIRGHHTQNEPDTCSQASAPVVPARLPAAPGSSLLSL